MIHIWHLLQHWLAVQTGTDAPGDVHYNFWSGFGSDLGELAIVGGLITVVRQHTCHTKRCWRLGKHPVDGTPWKVCRKCHPTIGNNSPTRAEIHADHKEANA